MKPLFCINHYWGGALSLQAFCRNVFGFDVLLRTMSKSDVMLLFVVQGLPRAIFWLYLYVSCFVVVVSHLCLLAAHVCLRFLNQTNFFETTNNLFCYIDRSFHMQM